MIIAGSPHPTPLPEKLSSRTRNTLARSGITTVEQVMDAYPIRLLKLPGFGMIALRDIEKALFPWQQYMPARKRPGRILKQPTDPISGSFPIVCDVAFPQEGDMNEQRDPYIE